MCYPAIEEALMRLRLDIYYDQGCPTCDHALHIARIVQEKIPDIIVTLIDLSESNSPRPDFIFAVPTYVLNDKTYSLGNPEEAILMDRLKAELDEIG
jgi:hypothetical protein